MENRHLLNEALGRLESFLTSNAEAENIADITSLVSDFKTAILIEVGE